MHNHYKGGPIPLFDAFETKYKAESLLILVPIPIPIPIHIYRHMVAITIHLLPYKYIDKAFLVLASVF